MREQSSLWSSRLDVVSEYVKCMSVMPFNREGYIVPKKSGIRRTGWLLFGLGLYCFLEEAVLVGSEVVECVEFFRDPLAVEEFFFGEGAEDFAD